MAIETVEFDLSMVNPKTGRYLTANTYTVDGVFEADGVTLRPLSIGQLVMALCLKRATDLETSIITLMNDIESTSEMLESLTKIEQDVIDDFAANTSGHPYDCTAKSIGDKTYRTILREQGILNNNQSFVRNDALYSNQDIMYDEFISKIESKMDEKNSFSQKTMIELQSQTNKRDQSYDMISNILKSLNTVLVGIANNT